MNQAANFSGPSPQDIFDDPPSNVEAGSRVRYLKTGIRVVLANTALIPLLTLTPVFRKYGFISR